MNRELLDIVNENNEVIGQERRDIVHRSGLCHRGVHVFLFTPDGKLLIQQRSKKQDTSPGALDCSISEHLNVGESYGDAAHRGLYEELGLTGISLRRLLRFQIHGGPNDNMISELYTGSMDEKPLAFDRSEVAQLFYYSLAEIEEMLASGKGVFTFWFVQLFRWYTGKTAEIQVISIATS